LGSQAINPPTSGIKVQRFQFERVLWFMPAAFALHICEEWFGGFPGYVASTLHGSAMSPAQFLINNAAFMLLLVGLSIWASWSQSRTSAVLLMAWASGNLFWDFFAHLIYTVEFDKYSPGLVTASLLYYPLPIWVTAVGIREGRLTVASSIAAYVIGGVLILAVIWGGVYHFHV
jgi:hypothetical protein